MICELYERTSIIITSNKGFDSWSEMMGDDVMTTTSLDRWESCLPLSWGIHLKFRAVSLILREEGFARLSRRADEERIKRPGPKKAGIADLRCFDLSERSFRTHFGGLFLFVPCLLQIGFERIIGDAGLPGSKMIPAPHAMRSLLALKLFGRARRSHVMSYVMDQGLALVAGLNVILKRSFLTECGRRIDPAC